MLSTNDGGGPDGPSHQPANGHTFKGCISLSDIPPENLHRGVVCTVRRSGDPVDRQTLWKINHARLWPRVSSLTVYSSHRWVFIISSGSTGSFPASKTGFLIHLSVCVFLQIRCFDDRCMFFIDRVRTFFKKPNSQLYHKGLGWKLTFRGKTWISVWLEVRGGHAVVKVRGQDKGLVQAVQ